MSRPLASSQPWPALVQPMASAPALSRSGALLSGTGCSGRFYQAAAGVVEIGIAPDIAGGDARWTVGQAGQAQTCAMRSRFSTCRSISSWDTQNVSAIWSIASPS